MQLELEPAHLPTDQISKLVFRLGELEGLQMQEVEIVQETKVD